MKLIDLLLQELPKRGGWPELATCVAQDNDELVMFADCDPSIVRQINGRWFMNSRRLNGNGSEGYKLADDYATSVITREQYEAALTAAQQPVWDGEGLPPVGCKVERSLCGDRWSKCEIIFISNETVVVKFKRGEVAYRVNEVKFRPIRSEADKKRDAAIDALSYYTADCDAIDIYDAIAAGKVPGVQIF